MGGREWQEDKVMGGQMGGKCESQGQISETFLNLFWEGISYLARRGDERKSRVGLEEWLEKEFIPMGRLRNKIVDESFGKKCGEGGYMGLETWWDQNVHCQIGLQNP